MNIQKITTINLILITSMFNIYTMERPDSDKTQELVNAMQTPEFASITQTPKFQAIIQTQEFGIMMQTPQFQFFLIALHSKSYPLIQEALEDLLETEALENLFKTGIFSDEIRAKHNAMKETEAYAEYQGAKQLYTEGGLTQEMVDDCKKALRSTIEYNDLIDAANAELLPTNKNVQQETKHNSNINNSHPDAFPITKTVALDAKEAHAAFMQVLKLEAYKDEQLAENSETFSAKVLNRYQVLQRTDVYAQYQCAKESYKTDPTPDAQTVIYHCLTEVTKLTEYKALIIAIRQEELATCTMIQSDKWIAEQIYEGFPFIRIPENENAEERETRCLAQEKTFEFLFNTLETQLSYSQQIQKDCNNNTTTASSTTQPHFAKATKGEPTQSNITNNSQTSSNIKVSLSNEEIAFLNMTQTLQYQVYDQAKKLHEKHNTLETKNLLEEALELLLKTQESQLFFQIKNQGKTEINSSQIYSDNVLAKNQAMEETPEFKQYQDAKLAYEQNPNENTKYMVDLCKAELRNTQECQEWLHATDQEQHITNNITNSEKWQREQEYLSFQDIASLQKERNIAWLIVQNTKEYEVFKKAELAHQLHGTLQSASLLKKCQEHAKETQEYKIYFKLDQQLRAITGEPQKRNLYSIQPQTKTNSNSYAINNNNDNNTTTASSTTQTQAIQIFSANVLDRYQIIRETDLYKRYQGAKQRHETDRTNYTHRIMCDSLAELILTQQWEGLVLAMRREQDPLNNIIQSKKWVAEQTYSAFPHLKGLLPTKESQDLQVKLVDFLCNKLETQLSVTQKQQPENNALLEIIQRSSTIANDCCMQHKVPKIDIQLTPSNNNNNYSPREICVSREIRLQLTNNKK